MFAEFGGLAGLVGDEGGFAAMRFFSLIVLAKVVFMLGSLPVVPRPFPPLYNKNCPGIS